MLYAYSIGALYLICWSSSFVLVETSCTYAWFPRCKVTIKLLESYLLQQLSQEEIEADVKNIIAEVGATSMREMGKVMGTASKQLAENADGRVVSEIVKILLT